MVTCFERSRVSLSGGVSRVITEPAPIVARAPTRTGATSMTAVEVLDDGERVRELSRMLAGLDDSSSAVSHAEELLSEAEKMKATA